MNTTTSVTGATESSAPPGLAEWLKPTDNSAAAALLVASMLESWLMQWKAERVMRERVIEQLTDCLTTYLATITDDAGRPCPRVSIKVLKEILVAHHGWTENQLDAAIERLVGSGRAKLVGDQNGDLWIELTTPGTTQSQNGGD